MTLTTPLPILDWTQQATPARPLRMALVNMPWARTHTPSIQCGLLKAGLTRHGHRVDVHHLNLDLSAHLGTTRYDVFAEICSDRVTLLSEWLFTTALYGPHDDTEYFEHLPAELLAMLDGYQVNADTLRELREQTLPEWIDQLATTIPWSDYDVVGFTSTFEQNLSSLALARQLKERYPQVTIICGGANFDGDMGREFARVFRFVDYVVSGEGDVILPVILARLSAGRSPTGLPGVSGWAGDRFCTNGQAPKVDDMNQTPAPDYTDYFAHLERLGRDRVLENKGVTLLYEASRGCWWGEKHHCTFCGLNAMGMAYRSKSPERVVADLATLTGRHDVLVVQTVDNIMDMRYLRSMCADLAERHWDVELFFEVKANLSREQLRALHAAGVRSIQPGVESLSTHVLGLMRKGSTMLTNVRMLKWARYYGFKVIWNILTGFPAETDHDYDQQTELVPSLLHLEPPDAVGRLWLERFSPYFTEDHPIRNVRAAAAYRFIYPDPDVSLDRVAYFFDYEAEQIGSDEAFDRLRKSTDEWKRRWESGPTPRLDYERGADWLRITDTRGERRRRITVRSWSALAYLACDDKPHTARRVAEHLATEHDTVVTEDRIAAFLDGCVDQRLMVAEDGKYLALALPRNAYW
jgi:ribosomal peptide maturation radical SAM protein 1